ncbi:MAG: pilin [Candidatus Paceibacterota bacterium]
MNKKNSTYLTASCFSLLIAGLVIIPSIANAGYSAPSLAQWGDSITIEAAIQKIVDILFAWVAPLCVLMIIVGGIFYMTAGDDTSKTKKAFDFIKYALIGLAVVLAAAMLMSFVNGLMS